LQNISSRECWNDIVVLLEVRRDASFSDCGVGLTMVPVEIWGEIPPLWNLVEISKGGMVWSARELFYGLVSFIDAGDGSHAGGYRVRWTRIGGCGGR
jgi:hypothetical protein